MPVLGRGPPEGGGVSGRSKAVAASEVSDQEEYKCLCGACHVRTGAIIIGITEILILCHSLIFAFTNFHAGPWSVRHSQLSYIGIGLVPCVWDVCLGRDKYELYNPVFAAVIKYDYLLPFFILQTLWICSNLTLLIGTKIIYAPLILPHLFVQIVSTVSGLILTIVCFVNIGEANRVNWELLVSIVAFLVLILTEIYFAFVMWSCYKYLKVMRVAVSAQSAWLAITQMAEEEEYTRGIVTVTKKNIEHMRLHAASMISHPPSAVSRAQVGVAPVDPNTLSSKLKF